MFLEETKIVFLCIICVCSCQEKLMQNLRANFCPVILPHPGREATRQLFGVPKSKLNIIRQSCLCFSEQRTQTFALRARFDFKDVWITLSKKTLNDHEFRQHEQYMHGFRIFSYENDFIQVDPFHEI